MTPVHALQGRSIRSAVLINNQGNNMSETKDNCRKIMTSFLDNNPVPDDVQTAISTMSDKDYKLFLENRRMKREGK